MDIQTQSIRQGDSLILCILGFFNLNCGRNSIQHVASNKYTRYRPYPTPSQFAASQDLVSRMMVFLRRELLVWPNADVEVRVSVYNTIILVPRLSVHPNCTTFRTQFLVTFVVSLMKSIDIRSESAIKLLAEFLDMDTQYVAGERHVNAEHFAHGLSEFWALLPHFCFWSHSPPYFYRNILLSALTIQRSRHIRLCCTSTYALHPR